MSTKLVPVPTLLNDSKSSLQSPNRLEKLLTGACLTLALLLTAASLPARGIEFSSSLKPLQAKQTAIAPSSVRGSLDDGIYLYGQSPEADQLGATYMVFEVNDRHVVGAFYMPSSSFDCFRGELQAEQLALMVMDSYDQTTHPYSVALQAQADVAASIPLAADAIDLIGYHRLVAVSDRDNQILATCQSHQGLL